MATSGTQGPAGGHVDWTPNGGFRPGVIGPVAVATQTINAATTAIVLGSLVAVPPQGFQIGTVLRWTIPMSKTAAGTAARTVTVKYGAAGSTADGTIASVTVTPSSTATADLGKMVIELVVTALGSGTSGAARAQLTLMHNALPSATTGGLSNVGTNQATMTMTGFDSTAPASGPRFLNVTITTGAAEVLTILAPCYVECLHPGNP